MKTRLLLLGLDRYVLRACAQLEVPAVVVCSHSTWERGSVAIPEGVEVLRVDDQHNVESVLAALHRAGYADTITAVQTSHEAALVTAAVLAQVLSASSLDPTTAVLLRDKQLQKERVRAAGLVAARAVLINDLREATGAEMDGFERAVLKPVAGSGTSHTVAVDNATQLREHARRARERGVGRTFLLEQYIDGDEWIADGVVDDGEVVFFGLGRYSQPCLTLVDENAPLTMFRFDPRADEHLYRAADPVVRRAIKALGLHSGPFHMELFHTGGDEVVFSECAGRRGGGMIQEEVECKFGVDLARAAVLCALGADPDIDPQPIAGTVGTAYLQGPPGTLVSCPSAAQLRSRPDVEFARVFVPYGTTIGAGLDSTTERLAEVLLISESEAAFHAAVNDVRRWFTGRVVVVPAGATERRLRAWQAETWPERTLSEEIYGR